mgnify:FL=1
MFENLAPVTPLEITVMNSIKISFYFYAGVVCAYFLTRLEGDMESPYIDNAIKVLDIWFFTSITMYMLLKIAG